MQPWRNCSYWLEIYPQKLKKETKTLIEDSLRLRPDSMEVPPGYRFTELVR